MKNKQLNLLKRQTSAHGGELEFPQKTARPLATKHTMHFVLRSSKARGRWSFRRFDSEISQIVMEFAEKYHIEVLSMANVGNHLHMHLKIRVRENYEKFIRAITASIMMKVTGFSRWNKKPEGFQFWDYRPFSKVVKAFRQFLNLKNYIQVNKWEGVGLDRLTSQYFVKSGRILLDTT